MFIDQIEYIILTTNLLSIISFSFGMSKIKNILRLILCLEIITFSMGVLCTCISLTFGNVFGIITAVTFLVCAAAETALLLAFVIKNYNVTESIDLNTYNQLIG